MTYKDRFVAAVKCGGRILREKDGVVYLPFGSEYSILLKNLESRKASIQVSIDGQDVLDGKSLLLNPNSSLDLERFVESLDKGNKFRFIQKTEEIVEHRGDKVDDGIVRVEFAFEQITKHVNLVEHITHDHYHSHRHYPCYWWYPTYSYYTTSDGYSGNSNWTSASTAKSSMQASNTCFLSQSSPLPDEGITVRGSESYQNFQKGYIGVLDPSEVIILRLRGEGSTGKDIEKPITVKDKVECETCGTSLLPTVNFCVKCGTAVRIV